MSELDLIEKLKLRVRIHSRDLITGIGDDCAIIRQRGCSEDLLVTTDMMIEGTHFRPGDDLKWVGRKALARALSDIAAMGGESTLCFASIAAPSETAVDRILNGVLATADETRTTLAGGDTARAKRITIDIAVHGRVPRGKALRRDGAKVGDHVYVSGPLGRAAFREYRDMPQPRLAFGRALRNRATACIDLSDGVGIDIHRLCSASNVGAAIVDIPRFAGATLDQALYGGEDYELLFTTRDPMPEHTAIGRVTAPEAGVLYQGNRLPIRGYDHFRQS